MRQRCLIFLTPATLLLVFSASACARADSGLGTEVTTDRSRSEQLSTVNAKDFDRSNFHDSTGVNNERFPLASARKELWVQEQTL